MKWYKIPIYGINWGDLLGELAKSFVVGLCFIAFVVAIFILLMVAIHRGEEILKLLGI